MQEYAERAGLPEHVHPHLFRHQMLTWLMAQGLPDAAIQLISGHASKKSLEVYQHVDAAEVVRRREQGQSWRDIAAGMGVGLGTVFRAYRSFRNADKVFQ